MTAGMIAREPLNYWDVRALGGDLQSREIEWRNEGIMGGGAIAAAARRKREQREEEEMTDYTRDDLEKGYEFKIVRSATGAFKKPQTLRLVVEQEARAGWTLLE